MYISSTCLRNFILFNYNSDIKLSVSVPYSLSSYIKGRHKWKSNNYLFILSFVYICISYIVHHFPLQIFSLSPVSLFRTIFRKCIHGMLTHTHKYIHIYYIINYNDTTEIIFLSKTQKYDRRIGKIKGRPFSSS